MRGHEISLDAVTRPSAEVRLERTGWLLGGSVLLYACCAQGGVGGAVACMVFGVRGGEWW